MVVMGGRLHPAACVPANELALNAPFRNRGGGAVHGARNDAARRAYARAVAVIGAPSPKLRQEGGPAAWVPQGGRSTFRRHAAHDRRAKDEQHCIDHDPIRNHVAFLLRTNMSGRVEARWQARCDGRHTTVGFPLQRNPSIGARFRSNLPAPMISSETSATFRIRRPVASPAPVPSSRCQTARFAASTASTSRSRGACLRPGPLPCLFSFSLLSLRVSPRLRPVD